MPKDGADAQFGASGVTSLECGYRRVEARSRGDAGDVSDMAARRSALVDFSLACAVRRDVPVPTERLHVVHSCLVAFVPRIPERWLAVASTPPLLVARRSLWPLVTREAMRDASAGSRAALLFRSHAHSRTRTWDGTSARPPRLARRSTSALPLWEK